MAMIVGIRGAEAMLYSSTAHYEEEVYDVMSTCASEMDHHFRYVYVGNIRIATTPTQDTSDVTKRYTSSESDTEE